MATHEWGSGHIEPFWEDEYKHLNYTKQAFNNPKDMIRWRREGYAHSDDLFVGFLCDMKHPQPIWNNLLIEWFEKYFNVTDVGTSYYRMTTGTILPVHSDTYIKYQELFSCEIKNIVRALVMPEDWQSGHYLEINGVLISDWSAGDFFWWNGDAPHMGANIGVNDRYTIQLTGHRVG